MATFELMIGSRDDFAVLGTIQAPSELDRDPACQTIEALLVEYLQVHNTTAGFLKQLNVREGWRVEYRDE